MSSLLKRCPSCLLLSLGMNLLLAAGWVWTAKTSANRGGHSAQQAEGGRQAGSKAKTDVRHDEMGMKEPRAAFKWQQLDAPDFATFVKNLRGIGCPEPTIRDIVQGELRDIYAEKRGQMLREIARAPVESRAGLELGLKQLASEEQHVADGLTLVPGEERLTTATVDPGVNQQASPEQPAATVFPGAAASVVPAAFLVGNDPQQNGVGGGLQMTPTDSRLNEATAAVLAQVREGFASAMEGAGNDSTSVIYRRRWASAKRDSDEAFSSMFGGDRFIQTQIEASQGQNMPAK